MPGRSTQSLAVIEPAVHILDAWTYEASFPNERKEALAAPGSFEEVIRLVKADITEISVKGKRGRDPGLTDCIQPVFMARLPKTFDLFFNGPWGYRAQYFVAPENGIAANMTLIGALTPLLMEVIDKQLEPDLSKINLCASLGAASAKVWIYEPEFDFDNPSRDLAIARWAFEADNDCKLARWGLCARQATTIEVKGALIDPFGHEAVPARKIRRHLDIYHYGFS